jgi:hypothetical protein
MGDGRTRNIMNHARRQSLLESIAMDSRTPRRPVPLWQIAPFCLIPAVVVAAASFFVALDARLILYTSIISCTTLLLIAAPHKRLRWVLAAAVIILGIVLALNGVSFAGLALVSAHWAQVSLGAGA